jgi:hypothetical protein
LYKKLIFTLYIKIRANGKINSTFERPRDGPIGNEHTFCLQPASGFLRDKKNVTDTYNLKDTINPENKSLILTREVLPARIDWPEEYYRYYSYMIIYIYICKYTYVYI